MKWLLVICFFVLSACAPSSEVSIVSSSSKPSFVSVFAGFFPQDPQAEVLPVWKGSLENLEPVVLDAIRSVHSQFEDAFIVDFTNELKNGLRIHEVRGAGLTQNSLQITLSETLEHVAVGVFDRAIAYPNMPTPNSFGGQIEKAIAVLLDAKFSRDRF